jgi:hypothetical protein
VLYDDALRWYESTYEKSANDDGYARMLSMQYLLHYDGRYRYCTPIYSV